MELSQILLALLTITVTIVTLSRFFAGRFRSELEAANIGIARRDAELEAKNKEIQGMSARLARLDEEREEWAGNKAYAEMVKLRQDLIVQQQATTDALRAVVDQIQTVGRDILKCVNNGHDKC